MSYFTSITFLTQTNKALFYKALDTRDNTWVVLKQLISEDEKEHVVFQAQYQQLSGLSHPHIIKVKDYFMYEGKPTVVMPYYEGENGQDYLQHASLSKRHFLDLLSAVAYLHRRNILHYDLKPSNCFILKTGKLMLLDIGYYSAIDAWVSLTPRYASPELLAKEAPAKTDDIYAVGLILQESLAKTGKSIPWLLRYVLQKVLAPQKAGRWRSIVPFYLCVFFSHRQSFNPD
jgi:serine/threonine protein kinase